jgi:hypothetical protein
MQITEREREILTEALCRELVGHAFRALARGSELSLSLMVGGIVEATVLLNERIDAANSTDGEAKEA